MKNFFLVSSLIVYLSACTQFPYPIPEPDSRNAVKARNAEQIGIDADLESRITAAIKNVFPNDDYELSIEVFNEKVFLIGTVYKEERLAQIYKFVATNFTDTEKIINLLYFRASKDSSMGFYDFDLANKIWATLISTSKLETDTIDYLVFDRKVYVYGYATKKQLETFTAMVSRVGGVNKIVILVDYVEGTSALKPYEEVVPPPQPQQVQQEKAEPAPSKNQQKEKKESQEITPEIQKIDETKSGDPAKQKMPDEGDVIFR